jgi:hypothetical protein
MIDSGVRAERSCRSERVPGTVRQQSANPELVAHTRQGRSPPSARTALPTSPSSPTTANTAGRARDFTISPPLRGFIARAGRLSDRYLGIRAPAIVMPRPNPQRSGTSMNHLRGPTPSRPGEDHTRRMPTVMRGARFPPAGRWFPRGSRRHRHPDPTGGGTRRPGAPRRPERRRQVGGAPDMRRPRPVALTGAKRRALRVIEETLTEEDPGLSVAARVVGGGRPGRDAACAGRPGSTLRCRWWCSSSGYPWLTRHDRSGHQHAAVHSGRPPVDRRVRASVAVSAT